MITVEEAEKIDEEFTEAFELERVSAKKVAEIMYAAWQHLLLLMERENNYSNKLGSNILDWQIGNWASDVTMALHNAGLHEECIKVNEDILKIAWDQSRDLFCKNAKREIADEYADTGNISKCYQLYEEYLEKDPLWGWGWIGYYRQLNEQNDQRYEEVLDELYEKIKSGTDFRDKVDLYRELGDEYGTLGNKERADFFYGLEDEEEAKQKYSRISASGFRHMNNAIRTV